MEIVDANVVLRYLLKDHKEFYKRSKQVLEDRSIKLPYEVIAEIVYVLEKVYEVPREKIKEALRTLLDYQNIAIPDEDVLYEALEIYESENIDFVDSLLAGYKCVQHYQIHTFDNKLSNICQSFD